MRGEAMARPTDKSRRLHPESFDVTCVVGTVDLTNDPTAEAPHVAAFRLIAEHNAEGVYNFPHEDGGAYRITVEVER